MQLVMEASNSKDVMIGIFGASAGLGGLVLVFLGLVIAGFQGIRADTPTKVKDRAKRAGWPIVGVFALSLISAGLSLTWLATNGGDVLYHFAIWVFVAELLAVFLLAVEMTRRMLR
jgi:hypothetical protein